MQVLVYNWEIFQRGRWWYIWFATFFVFMILISILFKNIVWALLLFLFVWWYLVYSLNATQKIKISVDDSWLKIWNKNYPFWEIEGFVLELDSDTQKVKNIVFLIKSLKLIHTLADEPENIKQFVLELSWYVDMLSDYPQGLLDRLVRRFKL